ncbi:hypothetical protein E2C01_040541 [Portunus trituberculatus]|uniref:Uncharacterized protein n=1 Tax=Portunus trituberculatus TaxID=210409 RepID=A0A5B7FJY6_PORTR|nr:hypothetical protein [Portunus trituberculatus]
MVLRIRLVYEKDFPSNCCYVTFLSCDEARLAVEHVESLPLAGSGFKTELLHSCNISDSDTDYIPNFFDHHSEKLVPEVCQIPPPRWFVAYYRNGRGNFIYASRYLAKEIGMIPEGNLKNLGSARRELLYCQKDGTSATSYASLAARSSAESAGLKTTTSATSLSVGTGGPVHLANRFALLSENSVESSLRSDENNTDLTKVTHVVDVHLLPVSPKPLKGLTNRHRGSAESIDLAQPKQSKVSPGAHDRESSRDHSARVAPVVSVHPSVMPSMSNRASCDEDGLSMETFDDVSPVGRKVAVQRPDTSHLPVSSRRLIISSQVSHGQLLQKARPSTAPK